MIIVGNNTKVNEAASPKQYTIITSRPGRKDLEDTGTLEELIDMFSYTLLKGKSWEFEKGNKKINKHPTNINSLITNLNNSESNSAANGCPAIFYSLKN